MECSLCLEDFNTYDRVPKVLQQCGHTFCEKCIMQVKDSTSLSCPMCKIVATFQHQDSLPNTNFQMMKVMEETRKQRDTKGVLERYQSNPLLNEKRIDEVYERIYSKHDLKLIKIHGTELIYKLYSKDG